MRKGTTWSIFVIIIWIFSLVGWVRCIIKDVNCNWDPIGKAEIWYTIGVCTGAGAVIGWMDIKDN